MTKIEPEVTVAANTASDDVASCPPQVAVQLNADRQLRFKILEQPTSVGTCLLLGFQQTNTLGGETQVSLYYNMNHMFTSCDSTAFHSAADVLLVLCLIEQAMVAASGCIAVPWLVADAICASNLAFVKVRLIGTTLFTVGLATVLQTVFGARLPLLQGPSFAFLPAIKAMAQLPQFQCPEDMQNETFSAADREEIWTERIQIIQGGIICASLVQALVGLTGLVGLLTRNIGPLTVAPLLLLLEISIVEEAVGKLSKHWISLPGLFLLILFAVYLNGLPVPIPYYSNKKINITWQPLFGIFPYLLAVLITWGLAVFLTVFGVFNFTTDQSARTDTNLFVVAEAPWITIPYPGQFGFPRFGYWGVLLGFLGATMASIVESIGDIQNCARVCQVPAPPTHALCRSVFMEGVGSQIAGWLGVCVSVTTYSENIGVIGITRVASRIVMIYGGVIFIVLGIMTKFGAVLVTMPDPLIGSILTVSLAIVTGVALSNIQLIDCKNSRNLSVLGLAIIGGLLVTEYVENNPFDLGNEELNQVFQVLFSIKMLMGGSLGFILDNTVPGATREERGFPSHKIIRGESGESSIYSFDNLTKKIFTNIPDFILKFIPICPNREDPEWSADTEFTGQV